MATVTDFRASMAPTWCAGCGDFSVLRAVERAGANLGLQPHEVVVVSGIGCSGKISQHFGSYGFHTLHGRVLPTATAVKVANRSLTVLAAGGDGDGYGIGVGHLVHACRRNVDITYLVMDNHIYGLTTGQTSPTTLPGTSTKSHPSGAFESTIAPLDLAVASGATFVAQGFGGDVNGLTRLLERAIRHPGFALLNVFSPCVTFSRQYSYNWYREMLVDLEKEPGYDPADPYRNLARAREQDGLVTGVIYETRRPTYESGLPGLPADPLARQDLTPDPAHLRSLLAEFR